MMRIGKGSISNCGGCVLTRTLCHWYELVLPCRHKLWEQSSELNPAVACHVIAWVSTAPRISDATSFGFATTPFTRI